MAPPNDIPTDNSGSLLDTAKSVLKQLGGDLGATAMDVGNAVTLRNLWGDKGAMDAERAGWMKEMGAADTKGYGMDAARGAIRFGAPAAWAGLPAVIAGGANLYKGGIGLNSLNPGYAATELGNVGIPAGAGIAASATGLANKISSGLAMAGGAAGLMNTQPSSPSPSPVPLSPIARPPVNTESGVTEEAAPVPAPAPFVSSLNARVRDLGGGNEATYRYASPGEIAANKPIPGKEAFVDLGKNAGVQGYGLIPSETAALYPNKNAPTGTAPAGIGGESTNLIKAELAKLDAAPPATDSSGNEFIPKARQARRDDLIKTLATLEGHKMTADIHFDLAKQTLEQRKQDSEWRHQDLAQRLKQTDLAGQERRDIQKEIQSQKELTQFGTDKNLGTFNGEMGAFEMKRQGRPMHESLQVAADRIYAPYEAEKTKLETKYGRKLNSAEDKKLLRSYYERNGWPMPMTWGSK